MIDIEEVQKTINFVSQNADCIEWKDFSDAGNPCYNPYKFDSALDEAKAAFSFAAVMISMPKYSKLHKELADKVAQELGSSWVSYDWLVKAVARLLDGTEYDNIKAMIRVSKQIRGLAVN